jgi:hypothetical protein
MLSVLGLNRFIDSWNNHRISEVNRGIPIQRALDNNVLTPLDPLRIPDTDTLLVDYRSNGGRINENMADLSPFDDNSLNSQMMTVINERFQSNDYFSCFNLMLSGDDTAVLTLIREHYEIVSSYLSSIIELF